MNRRDHWGGVVAFVLASACVGCGDDNSTTESPSPSVSTGEESAHETSAEPEPPIPEPAATGPYDIVPNRSIGPIRMGMTRAEVDSLGVLSPHPQYSAMTIPYTVYYDDDDHVHQMEVSLMHAADDLRVGNVVIPRSANTAEIERLLGDCTAPDMAIGGTTTECRDGGLLISIGSGNPDEVWLRISTIRD